jgi:hypothetical protein
LAAGSVPLYYGGPNIDDWLPYIDCIIDLRKFANPQAVEEFILSVLKNTSLYAQFHKCENNLFYKIRDYF